MMEDEVVRRRRWLTREAFLDYLGATNLIPGPNSTELAIHVGHARAGWPGLLVAGTCFILPAALMVTAIAWSYVRFGTLPAAEALLYGIKPVVIAVVVQAVIGLGRSALKTPVLIVVALGAVTAVALGVHELLVLFGAGLMMAALRRPAAASAGALALLPAAPTAIAAPAAFGLWPLFGVFLKIGAVLFGSGYVLLAFLRADLVERLGWLTERQLFDAVAVGQITPGPGVHHRHLRRLPARRALGRGRRHARHLPARLRVRGVERPAGAAAPAIADGRRGARRGQRRITGADGGGHRGISGARLSSTFRRCSWRSRAACCWCGSGSTRRGWCWGPARSDCSWAPSGPTRSAADDVRVERRDSRRTDL